MTEGVGQQRRGAWLGAALYASVLTVLLGAAFALAQSDVRGKGPFVSGVEHDVYRVRLFDRWTFYTEHPPIPFDSDLATSFVLMAVTGIALLAFAMAVKWSAPRMVAWFFLLTAVGATFMAFDEQCEFIDSIGYNVDFLYIPDVFFYGPPALLFAIVFRRILLASRAALAVIFLGGLVFLAAEGIDHMPNDRWESAEEKMEMAAVTFWAVGVAMVALDQFTPTGAAAAAEPSPEPAASGAGGGADPLEDVG